MELSDVEKNFLQRQMAECLAKNWHVSINKLIPDECQKAFEQERDMIRLLAWKLHIELPEEVLGGF